MYPVSNSLGTLWDPNRKTGPFLTYTVGYEAYLLADGRMIEILPDGHVRIKWNDIYTKEVWREYMNQPERLCGGVAIPGLTLD